MREKQDGEERTAKCGHRRKEWKGQEMREAADGIRRGRERRDDDGETRRGKEDGREGTRGECVRGEREERGREDTCVTASAFPAKG